MTPDKLSAKDEHELRYWKTASLREHGAKIGLYLREIEDKFPDAFSRLMAANSVLEIGPGPLGGFLPHVSAGVRVAVDPLIYEYNKLFPAKPQIWNDIEMCGDYFDQGWSHPGAPFDVVVAIDSLDHGELGFKMLPTISALLKPHGLLFMYVQMREQDQLNTGHDFALTYSNLLVGLAGSIPVLNMCGGLMPVGCRWYPKDIDNEPSDGKGGTIRSLLAVFEKDALA